MKVLVTGGLGNLGSWFVDSLYKQGCSVTILSRTPVAHLKEGVEFIEADVADLNSLLGSIEEYYDVCIHAASYNEHFHDDYSNKALSINSLGTDNLCKALLVNGVGKLIYLSTFHVYGIHSGYIDESTAVAATNDYGLTHFFAEKYIQKHAINSGLTYSIFRLTNSYGCPNNLQSNKWYLIFNDFCKQAFTNQEIVLKGNSLQRRDFIWMGDVATVIYKACFNPNIQGVFNLSSGYSITLGDLANIVSGVYEESFGIKAVVRKTVIDQEVESLVVNSDRLSAHLDINFSDEINVEASKILQLLSGCQNSG